MVIRLQSLVNLVYQLTKDIVVNCYILIKKFLETCSKNLLLKIQY